MKVKINVSALKALEAKVLAQIDKVGDMMLAAANTGAQFERSSHQYINRTGFLESSTQAKMERRSGAEIRVQLAMLAPYAGYVRARGLLGRIDDAAQQTVDAITAGIGAIGTD